MEKNYSVKYFHDNMPDWKRKKDPILTRFFYRPFSFLTASFCAKCGITANQISYWSALVAIIAVGCFLVDNYYWHIAGAVLCNVWLIMDCTDGNLARSVKKEAFGPFADAMSSYLLVGLLCTGMGVAVYFDGGILVSAGCIWIVLVGALASASDSLMRLIYQKYKNTEKELEAKGIIKAEIDERQDINKSTNWKNKIDEELGIGGILPIAILIATIFNALDIIVLYCLAFFGAIALAATISIMRKAIKIAREHPLD